MLCGMASETDDDRPRPRGADLTMQLDAVAGELDLSPQVESDEDQGHERPQEQAQDQAQEAGHVGPVSRAPTAPPPLPSKRPRRGVRVAFALVVLLMAGLGVAAGLVLLDHSGAAPAVPPPTAQRPARAPHVVELGEFVIHSPPAAPAAPVAPTAPGSPSAPAPALAPAPPTTP